jgi:hypothetical protein
MGGDEVDSSLQGSSQNADEGASPQKDASGEEAEAKPGLQDHPLFKKIEQGDLESIQNFLEVPYTVFPFV